MAGFEWNQGLSVGVEEIDNDHKRLLAIISDLANAIEENHEKEIIGQVFTKLEEYVSLHFQREEALIARCGYPDLDEHIQGHQSFIDKIPELKEQLLHADSVEVARDVYLFLVDWLLNHIAVDDMSYHQCVSDKGATDSTNKPQRFFSKIGRFISARLPLGKRILLTAFIPALGMLLLSLVLLSSSVSRYQTMEQLSELTAIAHEVNTLSHSLQAERGLTTGLIASQYQVFSPDIAKTRLQTDFAIQGFLDRAHKLSENDLSPQIQTLLVDASNWLDVIDQQRKKVDQQELSIIEMQHYFTSLIDYLLKIPAAFTFMGLDAELESHLSSFTSVVNLKEVAGQERALGTLILTDDRMSQSELHKLLSLMGQQQGLIQYFNQVASISQQQAYQRMQSSDSFQQVESLELQLYRVLQTKNREEIQLTEALWFSALSEKIDLLKALADKLVMDITELADQNAADARLKLYLTSLILLLITGLTLLACWMLNISIISPVAMLNRAMVRLSKGDQSFVFTDRFADDELGRTIKAYESCRRSLLQADIRNKVHQQRQLMDLKHKTIEHERYRRLASTDSLTGAVNRRKFNKLAEHELGRVQRYRRPLSLLMLDIDYFKRVNDTYGHAAGDEVLKVFYQACVDTARKTDIVARLGGEEFAILMPETDLSAAQKVAERIRHNVELLSIEVEEHNIAVTVSIGISSWEQGRFKQVNQMLSAADEALYMAKAQGRNQVVLFSDI
ncbi:bacteriohemerythrin [Neptuniibacter sp. PT8_73]|uniref:bacteriohemerythrin n=1 Tax=Neptuniibacter sp. PT8_73 TaxID=3398206 RepID=UPI0039F57FA4